MVFQCEAPDRDAQWPLVQSHQQAVGQAHTYQGIEGGCYSQPHARANLLYATFSVLRKMVQRAGVELYLEDIVTSCC